MCTHGGGVHLCSTESAGDPDVRLSLGGQACAPPSPGLLPCLSPLPTMSLLFQLTLHWCAEGAFDIHNLVQRRSRSPESLYGFHGNRLVRRTRCSAAVVGERETYSKIRLHKCGRSWINSFQGGQGERLGKALRVPLEGLPATTHWGPPSRAAHFPLWLLARLLLLPWAFCLGAKAPGCYSVPQFTPL